MEVNWNEPEMEYRSHQQSCCCRLLPGLLKNRLGGSGVVSGSFSAQLPAAPDVCLTFSRVNCQHG